MLKFSTESGDFLLAGKIVSIHGIRGDVKILPHANSPEFLLDFRQFYFEADHNLSAVNVLRARVHKNCVIAELDGVFGNGIKGAQALKDKIVFIDRSSVELDDGLNFIADIIGLRAINADTGEEIGIVAEVLTLPASNVYVIKGKREVLVPAVAEFVVKVDIDAGFASFRLIEGM